MTSSFCRTEKSKTELSSSQKGKNTFSRFSGFKVFLFIFVSAFFWSETSFAVVHSVENISEKVKGDRLSLSDVNSILGTIRGFFFDDSTGFVGIGTDSPAAKLEIEHQGSIGFEGDLSLGGIVLDQNNNNSQLGLDSNEITQKGGNLYVTSHDGGIYFRTDEDDSDTAEVQMFINAAGNVGIGNINPTTNLEVESDSLAPLKLLRTGTSGGNSISFANENGRLGAVGADAGNNLLFYVGENSSESMVIDSDGNLGIGTTEPNAKLEVDGSVHMGGFTESDEDEWPKFTWLRNTINDWDEGLIKQSSAKGAFGKGGFGIHFDDSKEFSLVTSKWTTVASFDGATKNAYFAGNVGIGTTEPNYLLDVNGTISGTGVAGALSDARHKNNIENLKYGLDEVLQLRPVNFRWNAEKVADSGMSGVQLGLIAQEVEGVLPEVVLTAPDQSQTKSIKYSALIPPMIQAIKDLESRDRAQQLQIAELQAELAALR